MKKSKAIKGGLAACAFTAVAAFALAGCISSGTTVAVPAGHYEGSDVSAAIAAEYARCDSCHQSLGETFDSVSGGSMMAAHLDAWSAYKDGSIDEEGKRIIEENLDDMERMFSSDANGQDCSRCHETTIGEDGSISAGAINTREYCTTCHDYDSVIESTANWGGDEKVNPHSSHLGEIACESCHLTHGEKNVMYCDECHAWGLPEGSDEWLSSPFKYSQKR